ncbi:MAG: amidohydrolase family protein [Planctomycetes bacterium]|nr:amidohydrolase family protein [Planctomycetota bacterium]
MLLQAFLVLSATGATAHAGGDYIALQAGTIQLVEGGQVLEGGGTILVLDGKIVAAGKDLAIPRSARVVDYGPDAVIVPGFVAANSPMPRSASERTADPTLLAIDNFDGFDSYAFALQEGITTAYLAPTRGRLIAGQGAVVKLAGEDPQARVLSASASIQGSVGREARNTPGYWKPPIPASIDVGLGMEQAQLPRTLMGAMVALREIFDIAHGGPDDGSYGPELAPTLSALMHEHRPWRMGANEASEVRALLAFFEKSGEPLVIDGGQGSAEVADQIAKDGFSVVVKPPVRPNTPGRDFGKDGDDHWPSYDTAARLEKAGVRFAIATPDGVGMQDLRFVAGVASRGGLSPAAALRAVTLSAAEILGVASRVGSIAPGKDADFAVFEGAPLGSGGSLLATWVDGELAFKAYQSSATVLSVENLYVGDGTILSPGELLLENGKIRAVGRRVGRPAGATVVHGESAMPGMIDSLGYLGLEGSRRMPPTRFDLKRIVEPGDSADRRVARAGVTTVLLTPRGDNRSGAPMLAYKPAGQDVDDMVVADPAALRLRWNDRNRLQAGRAVREVIGRAAEYRNKWDEYEKKLAEWTPPPDEPAKPAAKEEESKKDGDSDAKADPEKKDEEKKDSGKKKKGEEEAKPVTGAWETKITLPPLEATRMRLYVLEENGAVHGSLRCDALSDDLIEVSGERKEKKLHLEGVGSRGLVTLDAEEAKGKLKGKLTLGSASAEFEAEQTSTEYVVAGRSERRREKEAKKTEPKGKPRAPGIDPELEPIRRAMLGEAAVIIAVERKDEILACVDVCEAAGLKPILYGASEAWKVKDQIAGRVAGVLLTQRVVETDPETGAEKRNRFAELQGAGIPVAFHSAAEEGAADLPLMAAYAVAQGMSPDGALRALTSDAAKMFAIDGEVGRLAVGLDADVLLLDGPPADPATSVRRVWVDGQEVR